MPASIASSSSSQSRSSSSTSPSSIHLDSDYEQFSSIQKGSDELVRRIIHENKESKLFLSAWRVRCETLETEVARLAGLLESLEASRGREETRRETGRVAVEETKPTSPSMAARPEVTPRRASSNSSSFEGPEWRVVKPATSAIPQIDPSKSMSKQSPPPCNAFYLIGRCSVPKCKFSHLYQLTPENVEEMKRGARFHLCNALKNGAACTDPTCCYGHACPRGSTCGRSGCAFNDEQHAGPPSVRARR